MNVKGSAPYNTTEYFPMRFYVVLYAYVLFQQKPQTTRIKVLLAFIACAESVMHDRQSRIHIRRFIFLFEHCIDINDEMFTNMLNVSDEALQILKDSTWLPAINVH